MKQFWEKVNWAMVYSAREVYVSLKEEKKNPKSVVME